MQEQANRITYGLYSCPTCMNDPGKDCGDLCGDEWPDVLPPLWTDLDCWPMCKCCGQDAHLVTPLVSGALPA